MLEVAIEVLHSDFTLTSHQTST